MKTLREYIDQLDEISHTDFLDGPGSSAIEKALALYYLCKRFQNPNTQEILSRLKKSLSNFLSSRQNGKEILNDTYPRIKAIWQELEKTAPEKFNRPVNTLIDQADNIISNFNDLTEFNEGLLDEAGSPNAVARILDLSKNK